MAPTGTAPATTCYACGATATLADGERCDCGEPRWLATDPSGFDWPGDGATAGAVDAAANAAPVDAAPATESPRVSTAMWRYADLLPVGRPVGVGVGAGGTPLVRTARLDEYAGCRLLVKDEGSNPTGSFKDRGSAVGVAHAAAAGREWVGTVSHGNMAESVAAHAAGHGLDCVVLVPEGISAERLAAIARYDPTVLRVAGDYGRLYFDALDAGPDAGIEFVNSDAALRVAGQKTVALEILEAFARGAPTDDVGRTAPEAGRPSPDAGRTAPDALVLPVSSGGLASATWKALREVESAGLLDDPPRLYLVQAAACDPIARAHRRGAETVERHEDPGETVAYSIANPDPPSGNRALAAVRATGGAVRSVPDDEILDARRRLAERAGIGVEAASAVPLAGLRRLTADGAVGADETAVVAATGRGFGEGSGEGDRDGAAIRTVERADVPAELADLTG